MGAVLWGAAVKGGPRAYRQESARLEVTTHGSGDLRCSTCCWLLRDLTWVLSGARLA